MQTSYATTSSDEGFGSHIADKVWLYASDGAIKTNGAIVHKTKARSARIAEFSAKVQPDC
jgi:hypothetical protein